MLKEKLFKLLFPTKYQGTLKLTADLVWQKIQINGLEREIDGLKKQGSILAPLDFANVDDKAKPPHYLKDMTDDRRKNFIGSMETIYASDEFQTVVGYVINVLGNHSFQVEPDESKMRNGRYAVIGVRTLMKQFEEMHSEFMDSKKKDEDFDPLDIIPE